LALLNYSDVTISFFSASNINKNPSAYKLLPIFNCKLWFYYIFSDANLTFTDFKYASKKAFNERKPSVLLN
jgi:hypothetical protein